MAQVDTQNILDNVTKTYTITKDSTAGEIFEAAQAFVMDHAHINAGAADIKTLQQYQQFVMTLRGVTPEQETEQKQQIVNPADTRVKSSDNDKMDDLFDNNKNNQNETISLKIGGLDTSWSYDWRKFDDHEFNEIGAAQRLTDAVKGHVAYDVDRAQFRAWNSQRWVWISGEINQLTQLTREILNCMVNEASVKYGDDKGDGFKDTKKQIDRLGTQPKMIQILKLSQTEDNLGVSNVRYNSKNYLINCINGEVDIRTGELQEHDKSHLFTKIVPFRYNPNAKSELWQRFLNTSFENDQDRINYFQIAIGDSSLSGVNEDRHMYINFGREGHDGKSVAMSAIRHTLGGDSQDDSGFADTADIKTFLKSGSGSGASARPDLANLDGIRFVTPSEPDKNAKLDEGLVKSLTGKSDAMKVRNLYSSVFTLYPQFSIWISANDIPKSSASQPIMDRLIIVPWNHRVRKGTAEDDPTIESKLAETKNCEAIFTWLVQGSVKANNKRAKANKEAEAARQSGDFTKVIYQDPLMPFPSEVEAARNKYQYSANSSLAFIFDVLRSKDEMMNVVIQTMLSNDNTLSYLRRGISSHLKGNDSDIVRHVFDQKRLVFDPTAYVKKDDLYRMYRSWCSDEGINKVATKRTFGDTIKDILADGRQNSNRVWLGVGMMPYVDLDENYMKAFVVGNYVSSLKNLATKYDSDHLDEFSKRQNNPLFKSDLDQRTTDAARDNIQRFIDGKPSSYANKYTTNYDNIDWPEPLTKTTKSTFAQKIAQIAANQHDDNQSDNQPNPTEETEETEELNKLFND